MAKVVFELDGRRVTSLDQFFAAFRRAVGVGPNRSLDAFNDYLRGGMGTPADGFVLRWRHHAVSRAGLGHPATARWLEAMATTCHPANVSSVEARIAAARRCEGPTLFDEIVEIIRDHGPGGSEAEDGVDLELC